jgi:hypothetical protein
MRGKKLVSKKKKRWRAMLYIGAVSQSVHKIGKIMITQHNNKKENTW